MSRIFLPLPLPLTPRQWFYIGGMQCLVAGIIDGGANFGIAYAMYHGQSDVRMWVFSKNTIAGDLGVTPLIQTAVSMIITSTLVHTDLHHSAIRPLTFVYPHISHLPDPSVHMPLLGRGTHTPASNGPEKVAGLNDNEAVGKRGLSFYFKMLIRFIFEGTENNMILNSSGPGVFFKRLLWTAVQGLGIGVVVGFPLWCLAIVILGPIYGNGNMGNKWAPQVIKLVYAFILGILTNPIIAILALGSQAEHHLLAVESTDPEKQARIDSDTTIAVPVEVACTPRGPPPSLRSTRRPSITAYDSTTLVAPPPDALSTPGPSRPRALSQPMSNYSLGGTGGRAQRPRAASRASERSTFSNQFATGSAIAPPDTPMSSRAIPLAWREQEGPTSPSGAAPPSPSPQLRPLGPAAVSRLRSHTNQLDAPRESMEVMAGDDVFGPAQTVDGESRIWVTEARKTEQ